MRSVLLTGATGFVGRQILTALQRENVAVRAVVRKGNEDAMACCAGVASVIVTADLFAESAAWWQAACAGVDTVIHAAWYAEPGKYLHSPLNLDCLSGTLLSAKGAHAAGVRRYVGIGTCVEYDLSAETLSPATPLRPETPYAAAKAAAYSMLSHWCRLQGMAFSWCRLFYLYGEGEDSRRLIPYLRNRLAAAQPVELSSGRQVRDYLDVAAAGRMIADAALSEIEGPVNICSGVPTTVRELAERVADEYGRRDLLRFGMRAEQPDDPPRVVGVPGGGGLR